MVLSRILSSAQNSGSKSVLKDFAGYKLLMQTPLRKESHFVYHRHFPQKKPNSRIPMILKKHTFKRFLSSAAGRRYLMSLAMLAIAMSSVATYYVAMGSPELPLDPLETLEMESKETSSPQWI